MESEKISIRNKALILSIALLFVFMVGAVSAANETDVPVAQEAVAQDVTELDVTDDAPLSEPDQSPTSEETPKTETTIKSDDRNVIKGKEFSVQLTDSNSTPIANKEVQFTFNNVVTKSSTDDNGVAKLKINSNPGEYTVKYSFSGDGYVGCENTTKIWVITSSNTNVKAKDYNAYVGFKNVYTVLFRAGANPLPHKWVTFKINGKQYSVKTTAKGNAMLTINEKPGKYKVYYSFGGQDNLNAFSGSSKIIVKKGMPIKIIRVSDDNYRNKHKGYFKVKVTDARDSILKKKKVVFKIKGKKYVKRTNSKGIATLKIKMKTGTYKIKAYTYKNYKYNKGYAKFFIHVRPTTPENNGMWLFGRDMNSVNLKELQKNGFKHILLNFKAIELYGKSGVEKWVKKANSYGIKVHLWMQVFYGNGGWENPVSGGSINYGMINSKVNEAKSYAKIKGIAGVHFDYVRYAGNAHSYSNSVNAINTFIKKATTAVHGVNKNLIVSAAVMPEPSGMEYYYGQDIPTMGRYLDAIIPMVYKGNYNAGTSWIKWVTQTFEKQSSKAKIWTGLQSYGSDENTRLLSSSELMGDARAAMAGGADGVILFRFGLFNDINFKEM